MVYHDDDEIIRKENTIDHERIVEHVQNEDETRESHLAELAKDKGLIEFEQKIADKS